MTRDEEPVLSRPRRGWASPRPRARSSPVLSLTVVLALASAVAGAPGGASAQPVNDQSFSAYGSGTLLGVNVLRLGNVQALNAQVGYAAQARNSEGLTTAISNELGYPAQPAQPGKGAYARGTGAEVGLVTPVPPTDPNQILLAGLAQSSAPPIAAPVTKQLGPTRSVRSCTPTCSAATPRRRSTWPPARWAGRSPSGRPRWPG